MGVGLGATARGKVGDDAYRWKSTALVYSSGRSALAIARVPFGHGAPTAGGMHSYCPPACGSVAALIITWAPHVNLHRNEGGSALEGR